MKSLRVVKLAASDVEELIKDLSLLVVSMDRIGSTYYDNPKRHATEIDRYFAKIRAFKRLARARGILSQAYHAQSTKADILRLEESAEKLRYWRPKR